MCQKEWPNTLAWANQQQQEEDQKQHRRSRRRKHESKTMFGACMRMSLRIGLFSSVHDMCLNVRQPSKHTYLLSLIYDFILEKN